MHCARLRSLRRGISTTGTCRTRPSTWWMKRARICGCSRSRSAPVRSPFRRSRTWSRASRASRRRTGRGRIEALSSAIKMSRSGLGDQRKPVGSFLFSGPTGVGKTEVTRQLALAMGVEFVRFDMSEYMERHTVSRLIGAPPGYVGFDQGGLLTEAIAKHPHCVLLLDEIEKAHPDVFNLLLQVMDHGTLTDNNGRKADFRHVIIIMTTNAGAFEMSRPSIGFTQSDTGADGMEAIRRLFSPEFRNRLDAVIQFGNLDQDTIERVVDKILVEAEAQLEQKGVSISIDEPARRWIAKRGYDPKMGARPMARIIQEFIKRPLAEELLFGKLVNGGHVEVTVSEDGEKLKLITRGADQPALLSHEGSKDGVAT